MRPAERHWPVLFSRQALEFDITQLDSTLRTFWVIRSSLTVSLCVPKYRENEINKNKNTINSVEINHISICRRRRRTASRSCRGASLDVIRRGESVDRLMKVSSTYRIGGETGTAGASLYGRKPRSGDSERQAWMELACISCARAMRRRPSSPCAIDRASVCNAAWSRRAVPRSLVGCWPITLRYPPIHLTAEADPVHHVGGEGGNHFSPPSSSSPSPSPFLAPKLPGLGSAPRGSAPPNILLCFGLPKIRFQWILDRYIHVLQVLLTQSFLCIHSLHISCASLLSLPCYYSRNPVKLHAINCML